MRLVDLDAEKPYLLDGRYHIEPVKHGWWIVKHEVMECGICGWITEYYAGLEEEWNYCPHCGNPLDEVE